MKTKLLAGLALIASPTFSQSPPQFGPAQVALDPLATTNLYGPSPYAYAKSNISERTLGDSQISLYGGGGLIGDERIWPLVKGLSYGVYGARRMAAAELAAVPTLIAAQEKATGKPLNPILKTALAADTWISAGRSAPKPFGYGRYRTTYRGCVDPACWNAPMWLFSRVRAPFEIDIEVIKGTTFAGTVHYWGGKQGFRVPMPTPAAWHSIGYDWLPGLVIWYIDEKEVGRAKYPWDGKTLHYDGAAYLNANLSIGSKDCGSWVCMPTAATRANLQMVTTPITYAPMLNAPAFIQ